MGSDPVIDTLSVLSGECPLRELQLYFLFSLPLAPYDPPINVTVHYDPYNLNDTFLFTWQKVEGRLNGILRGYEVRWKSVNAATYNKKIINTTSSESNSKKRRRKRSASDPTIVREIKLTNLSVYTNYSLEVAAITVRVGTYSDKKYFMSQEGGKSLIFSI